jgi:hypothetical protein
VGRTIFAFCAALAFAIPAGAVPITVEVDPAGRYIWPVEVVVDGTTTHIYAGVVLMRKEHMSANGLSLDVFREITPAVSYGYDAYSPTAPAMLQFPVQIPRVAWLVETEMPDVLGKSKPRDAAALQLAVLDLFLDGGDGLTSGSFRRANNSNFSSIYSHAANLISSSRGRSTSNGTILAASGPTGWTSVLVTRAPAETFLTPDAPTLILTGSALVLLAAAVRRRRSTRSTSVESVS